MIYLPEFSQAKRERKLRNHTRSVTYQLIKKGEIDRINICEVCEEKRAVEVHHPDYSDPWRIVFVCKKCHGIIGAEEEEQRYREWIEHRNNGFIHSAADIVRSWILSSVNVLVYNV